VTGNGFKASASSVTLVFGGTSYSMAGTTSATGVLTNASFTVPTVADVSGGYTVAISDGTNTSANFATKYTVTPQITSLSPQSGSVGTSVTITGNGFAASSASLTGTFNGTAVTISGTTSAAGVLTGATFTVPTASAGSYVVTVKDTSGNQAATSGATNFTVITIGLVQQVNTPTTSSVSSLTVTLPNNVTAGDTLILSYASEADSNNAPSTVTYDGSGFTKEAHNQAATGYGSSQVWALFNASGGFKTITITLSGSTYIQMADVTEWSGLVAVDQNTNSGNTNTGTSVTAGSITTTAAPELVISAAYAGGGNTTQPSTPSGFNSLALAEGGSPANYRGYGAYEIQTASEAIQATWTQPASAEWSAAIASFKT
jgi:hypothetical protein